MTPKTRKPSSGNHKPPKPTLPPMPEPPYKPGEKIDTAEKDGAGE